MKKKLIDSVCNKSKVENLEVGDYIKVYFLHKDKHSSEHISSFRHIIYTNKKGYLIYKIQNVHDEQTSHLTDCKDVYAYCISNAISTYISNYDDWEYIGDDYNE